MKISVFFEEKGHRKELSFDREINVKELLKKLEINLGSVIVIRNDELIDFEEKLNDRDVIRLMPVVSGG